MAAPKENQFWKLRSKHGRDKLFTSPELLWDTACEYFNWCDEHPEHIVEQKKGNINIKELNIEEGVDTKNMLSPLVYLPTKIPYTLTGLCLYFDCSRNWWNEFKNSDHKDFVGVITRIEETVYEQKFKGAAVGYFNANIIARDLGLTDKNDFTTNGKDLNASIQIEIINKSDQVDKLE
jgi:hypothetical protein